MFRCNYVIIERLFINLRLRNDVDLCERLISHTHTREWSIYDYVNNDVITERRLSIEN